MSLKTWEREFYPVEAKDCPKEEALDHSIQKWRGLLPSNLSRHGVKAERPTIVNRRRLVDYTEFRAFFIDNTTCALCRHHFSMDRDTGLCGTCPLYLARDKTACFAPHDEESRSPFDEWGRDGNPRPMLVQLRRAKKWVEAQKKAAKP